MMKRYRSWLRVMVVFLVGLLLTAPPLARPAQAQTYSVSCPSNPCSVGLIQTAINGAHAGDTIMIGSGTYQGIITIPVSVTLQGAGATSVTIDGQQQGTVVTVSGAGATLSGLTITGGAGGAGGGITNIGGTLTVQQSTVRGNSASTAPGRGAGIYNAGGTVLVSQSRVMSNTTFVAAIESGGIYNSAGGTLTVRQSTLSGNTALGEFGLGTGGGLYNAGTATLSQSTLSGNAAPDAAGIANAGGTLLVRQSTLSGNTAVEGRFASVGGGIANDNGGTLLVSTSTLSGNGADFGGGIANDGGTLLLSQSTLSGNTTLGFEGVNNSGALDSSGGTTTVRGSIMARQAVGADCAGTLTSAGYNLDSDGTCYLTATGDISHTNPLLGPLTENGGPSLTMALLLGSPAINAIPLAACTDAQGQPLTTDQRGVARPQGPACDIGAYEATISGPTLLFSDGFESGDFRAWSTVQTNAGGTAVVESYLVQSGHFAARLSATDAPGSYAYARKTFAMPQTHILVDGDFNVRAQGAMSSTVPLFRLFDAAGSLIVSLYRLNQTNGQLWVQHSGGYHRTIGRLPLKSWAHLELYVATVGSHASTVDVRLNTTSIYVAQGASLGTAGVQTVQIGNEAHAQAFDLLVDNVTVQAAS